MYCHIVSSVAHIKLDAVVHAKSHRLPLPLPNLLPSFIALYTSPPPSPPPMSDEADQTSNIAYGIPIGGTESAAGAESNAAYSTSSSTMADHAMVRKEIPPLYQY
jgi:hypothetical protein